MPPVEWWKQPQTPQQASKGLSTPLKPVIAPVALAIGAPRHSLSRGIFRTSKPGSLPLSSSSFPSKWFTQQAKVHTH